MDSSFILFVFPFLQENFKSVVQLTEKAREQYREMIIQIEKEIAEHPPRVSVPGVPHIFAHMGHSRTPSGCSVISFTSSILSEPISENYPHSEPETDHRGYEIEKDDENDDIDDDIDNSDGNDDAYEADDESGFERKKKKKTKDKFQNFIEEKEKAAEVGAEYILVNAGDNLGQVENDYVHVARRPGILKNSTERLKKQSLENSKLESAQDGDDNQGNIVNSSQIDADEKNAKENKSERIIVQGEPLEAASKGNELNNGISDDDDDDLSDKSYDFQTCEEISDADLEMEKESQDKVKELPQFIDSAHSYDLNEILSQHSAKTIENGEDVLSTHSSKTTHSSRTLEGGGAFSGDRIHDAKTKENVTSVLKGKAKVDKENRTLSWVKETQTLHFNEQIDQGRELEENVREVNGVTRECLDAVA